jgi:hypothetical protein
VHRPQRELAQARAPRRSRLFQCCERILHPLRVRGSVVRSAVRLAAIVAKPDASHFDSIFRSSWLRSRAKPTRCGSCARTGPGYRCRFGAFETHDCSAGTPPFALSGLKPSPVQQGGSCWAGLPPGRGKIDTMAAMNKSLARTHHDDAGSEVDLTLSMQAHGRWPTGTRKRADSCLEVQVPGSALSRSGWLTVEVRGSVCRGTSRQARFAHDPYGCGSRASDSLDRIDAGVLPPGGFIAYAVHQSMMDAQRSEGMPCCDNGGAGTASVLLSTGTGSSAPASPGPSEGRFNLHFFGQRPAFFGQPFG